MSRAEGCCMALYDVYAVSLYELYTLYALHALYRDRRRGIATGGAAQGDGDVLRNISRNAVNTSRFSYSVSYSTQQETGSGRESCVGAVQPLGCTMVLKPLHP